MGTTKFDRTQGFKVVLTTNNYIKINLPFPARYITFVTDNLVHIGLNVIATGVLTEYAYQDGEFEMVQGAYTAPEQGYNNDQYVTFKRSDAVTTTVHMVIHS